MNRDARGAYRNRNNPRNRNNNRGFRCCCATSQLNGWKQPIVYGQLADAGGRGVAWSKTGHSRPLSGREDDNSSFPATTASSEAINRLLQTAERPNTETACLVG